MKALLPILACFLFLSFLGCVATVPMATPEADKEAKTFTPAPGKANIYIVRSSAYKGSLVVFKIAVDRVDIGEIASGSYFLRKVDPGTHIVTAISNENMVQVRVDAQANKNYFVQVYSLMGTLSARVVAVPMGEEEGKNLVFYSKRAVSLEN